MVMVAFSKRKQKVLQKIVTNIAKLSLLKRSVTNELTSVIV